MGKNAPELRPPESLTPWAPAGASTYDLARDMAEGEYLQAQASPAVSLWLRAVTEAILDTRHMILHEEGMTFDRYQHLVGFLSGLETVLWYWQHLLEIAKQPDEEVT
jgi:hypothetical protein